MLRRAHEGWLRRLGVLDVPWMIFGSAPDPTLPATTDPRTIRLDINNAGRTAAELGLPRADLTLRARKKSWEEHRHLDTRGLVWVHEWPAPVLRAKLLTRPHDHVGSVRALRASTRERMVAEISGVSLEAVGDLGKVTNGVAAICYGLLFAIPRIVVVGISPDRQGHSYDTRMRERRQIAEDAAVLAKLARDPRIATTETDLAHATGLRLVDR